MFGMNEMGGYSLSDIAAATGNDRDGFGNNNGAWWIIILFLFIFCGWGNNGFGNRNGSTTREEVTYGFDMNNLENGIRGIQQGLCDGFYSQNSTMLQGFNGLNTQISNGVNQIENALCQGFNGMNIGMLQGFNGIQAQMANDALVAQQCCCQTQNLINQTASELNYNLATQSCDTRRAICDSTRDIIDAQNCNTRAILDYLTQDKISTLTAENQALKFAASQANQNSVLGAMMDANTAEILRRTSPIPTPAYVVNPPTPVYNSYGCGGCCTNTCGCC